jgi:hypothetical protein
MNLREYVILNRKLSAKYEKRVLSHLNAVKDRVITSLKTQGRTETLRMLQTSLIVNGITDTIKELYKETGLIHARRTYRSFPQPRIETKAPVGLGFSQTWTSNIIAILQQFLTDKILFKASETTKEILLKIISKGIEQGQSVDEIVKALEETTALVSQSERIVRTEVNRASNIGITEAGKSFPFEQFKEWISIRDLRTRGADIKDHANHVSMHGQRVDFDSFFIDPRNGDTLFQPGDPSAKAESTINCRCTMRLIAKRDERGRLVRKRQGLGITVIPSFNRPQTVITI